MNPVISHLKLWLQKEIPLIPHANPLLVLSIIFLIGIVSTRLSKKMKLPSITGEHTCLSLPRLYCFIQTPKEHYDLHLSVLQTIAKIFGHHPHIKGSIIDALKPEEVLRFYRQKKSKNSTLFLKNNYSVDKLAVFFEVC